MTRHNDLAQDFFEVLVNAHRRVEMPASQLIDKTMVYYRARSRYPGEHQNVLRKNEDRRHRWRQRSERLLKQGLCARCGESPPHPGATMCRDCLNGFRHRRARQKARWDERSGMVTYDA